jgi:hypothetical protein
MQLSERVRSPDPLRLVDSSEEHEMNANVKPSQQDDDARKQSELTRSVGVRLTTPEKATTSRWGAIKRVLRLG